MTTIIQLGRGREQHILNLLAPISRPIFSSNHNIVMKTGGDGLSPLFL